MTEGGRKAARCYANPGAFGVAPDHVTARPVRAARPGLPAAPVADAGPGAVDHREQLAAVLEVADEVDLRSVDHQERPFVVGEEELRVGARDLLDVLGANWAL